MRLRLFAVALMCTTSAFAQMRETVNVNVIEVPVSVADSSGNPVRGLTAANFEIYDNGKKQTITAFDKVDFGSKEVVSSVSPLNPSARRSFLILFDLGFSSPRSLVRAQEAARSFVTTAVHPRDLVGVGTIDIDHSFRLLTAFTTDHDLVAAAISDPHNFHGKDPLQIGNRTFVSDLISTDNVGMQDAQDASPGAPGTSGDAANLQKQMRDDMRETQQRMTASNEEFVRDRVERQIDYLADLAKTLRAVPGRKQVIFLSEGFDAKYVQGRDARDTKANQSDFEKVAKGQVWDVDTNQQFGSATSQSMLDRMARTFRSSDVVLNAIDIQGVRIQNENAGGAGSSSLAPNSNEGLFAVSRPTGGEVFRNTNDLKSNFDRMLHAQEVTYVLSFQGSASSPGKIHDLKVKLVDASGRVSSRLGYYENGGESAGERALSTAEVVINDIPQSGVRVAAFAAPFPVSHGNSQVPVILELNGADLAKQVRGNAAGAEIYVYAFDSEGIVRDRLYQRVKLDMQKIGDRLRASGLRYYGTLVLPPGAYAIKSLVLAGEPDAKRTNDADRRGYARTDVVVPQAGDVALLPPIPIDEQSKWVLVKGTDRGATGEYPFELSGQIFIPSATASNKVAVVVYGAAANELTWETTPKTKLLGTIPAMGATKFILQLDDPAPSSSLQVTMHMKGVAEPQTTSVALVRP